MRITTSNRTVARCLRTIEDTVGEGGGTIHPSLTAHHRDESLWITLPRRENPYADDDRTGPHPDAPEALRIPIALNVPVTHLQWDAPGGHLEYSGDTGRLTSPQRTILDAMVELFNACDKVRLVGEHYPRATLAGDPTLSSLIRRLRPTDWQEETVSPAQLVVRSRLLIQMGEGEGGPLGVFMPITDMLNHHPQGSQFAVAEGDLVIQAHHPTGTDQLFARYNNADALGLATRLGYLERGVGHLESVPGEVQVPGVGPVTIGGAGPLRQHQQVPRVGLSEDGTLSLAGLILRPGRMSSLRELLAMPLMGILGQALVDSRALAGQLLTAVLDLNTNAYSELRSLCARPGGSAQLRELFGQVADHQLRLLAACRAEVADAVAAVPDAATVDVTDSQIPVATPSA